MKKLKVLGLTIILAISFQMCKPVNESTKDMSNEYVSIKGQNFIDPQGRTLTLHGINVTNKDPKTSYLGHISKEELKMFKSWGFNVLRLGIIWDGLEPEPGVYNEEYLKGMDEIIQWAKDLGLYVFLDMHQDLYSVEFSDGAPPWATITNGQPHRTGSVWSESYLISPAVQIAFDNFWANTPAPDGIGIQDHYLNLWKYLADRYKDNTSIIGYDIMNEPFMGSGANQIMPLLLQSYAQILVEKTGQAPPSEEELMRMWSSEQMKVLEVLSEKETYEKFIDAIYEENAKFESGILTTFFQKARDAIREVNEHHIIFTEHSYFTNMGVTSALGELVDKNGRKDTLVAYAAHGYDLVVDTDVLTLGSNDRVELIFERIAQTGKRLNVPVLIGEWGALHGESPDLIPTADFLIDQFNKHGFSDTFWAYGKFLLEASFLEVLQKPYPIATSGSLEGYDYNLEDGNFICTWQEDQTITASTVIYVNDVGNLSKDQISINPKTDDLSINQIEDSNAGYLIIPASGNNIQRKLSIKLSRNISESVQPQ